MQEISGRLYMSIRDELKEYLLLQNKTFNDTGQIFIFLLEKIETIEKEIEYLKNKTGIHHELAVE